jgi:hypothetical protein
MPAPTHQSEKEEAGSLKGQNLKLKERKHLLVDSSGRFQN